MKCDKFYQFKTVQSGVHDTVRQMALYTLIKREHWKRLWCR